MSEICKNWSTWLKETRFSYMDEAQIQQTLNWLTSLRDSVLNFADLKEGQKIADFGCGTGLLAFGILERFEDKVELIFSDKFDDCLQTCKNILSKSTTPTNVKFLQSDLCQIKMENNYLDRALTRSVLVHIVDKQSAFNELFRVIKPDGKYCAFEPIISENTRYYELLSADNVSDYEDFKKAEQEFMSRENDPLVNFTAESLDKNLIFAGFRDSEVRVEDIVSKYIAQENAILNWFITPPAPDQKTVKQRFLEYFDETKVDNFIKEVQQALHNKEVTIKTKTAFIKAVK